MVHTINFMERFHYLYHAPMDEPVTVHVPKLQYLMLDGKGDPNSPEFQEAAMGLLATAHTVKSLVQETFPGLDYVMLPLEGIWWSEESPMLWPEDRSTWHWTLLILQPTCVQREHFSEAIQRILSRKDQPTIRKIRLEYFHEGESAQIMHQGPLSAIGPVISRIHVFLQEKGYTPHGNYHEIYLSDLQKEIPARRKTILRQPFSERI